MAGLAGQWPNRLIRLGALTIFVGLASCALLFNDNNLAWVMVAVGLVGVGFGVSYAFIIHGILATLTGEERALGGAGIATARFTGGAAGAALAAAVANLAGFVHGFSVSAARTAGVWVFLAALPVAALACLSAWQMGRPSLARVLSPTKEESSKTGARLSVDMSAEGARDNQVHAVFERAKDAPSGTRRTTGNNVTDALGPSDD